MSLRPLTGPRLPAAKGKASHLVVLCHGYGADGNDLIGLAPHWQRMMPSVAFASPNAPEPCPGAPGAYQWFPIARLDPQEMERGVAGAAADLDGFITAELNRLELTRDRLALVGFSQGTMMSLHVGLRGAPPACIVGYSGLLAGAPPPLDETAPPVLMIHGESDPMIPVGALFDSAAALGHAGASVQWHVSPGVGHAIDETGLLMAGEFIVQAFRGLLRRRDARISSPLP